MTQVQIKNYIMNTGTVLGKGSTGTVYLGVDTHNGKKVAIKVIQLKTITNEVTQYLLQNQVNALKMINHPNVLHAYDVITDSNCYYIVTNYCPNNTLDDYIKKRGRIPEEEALKIFKQIVQGYATINTKNILHRDLKPSNILFSETYQPVICDFGYCEIIGFLPKPKLQYNVGSPAYMAPESITGSMYSEGSQIWSLGTILYEMLQGRSFAHGKEVMHAIMQIKRRGPYVPDGASEFSKEIIRKCMSLKPTDRIKVKDLLAILNGGQPRGKHPRTSMNLPMTQSLEFVAPKNKQVPFTQNPNKINSQAQKNQINYQLANPQGTKHLHYQMTTQQIINVQGQQQFQLQHQFPPSAPPQQNSTNISQPLASLVESFYEDRPPSSPSKPTFRPVSSRLGIDQHNLTNPNIQIFNKSNTSGMYKPDDFPEYIPDLNLNIQTHLQTTNDQYVSSASTFSIPSQMRNQYIQSNFQNIRKQNPSDPVSACYLSQNYPFSGIKPNSNLLTVPASMLGSKRSTGSGGILNQSTFMNPSGGMFAKNTIMNQQPPPNPFLKITTSKVNFVNPNLQDSRSLQQIQLMQPSSMLLGLSKSKGQSPGLTESGHRNRIKSNQHRFQTQMSFGKPSNNSGQHPYYPQSSVNTNMVPMLVTGRPF